MCRRAQLEPALQDVLRVQIPREERPQGHGADGGGRSQGGPVQRLALLPLAACCRASLPRNAAVEPVYGPPVRKGSSGSEGDTDSSTLET